MNAHSSIVQIGALEEPTCRMPFNHMKHPPKPITHTHEETPA